MFENTTFKLSPEGMQRKTSVPSRQTENICQDGYAVFLGQHGHGQSHRTVAFAVFGPKRENTRKCASYRYGGSAVPKCDPQKSQSYRYGGFFVRTSSVRVPAPLPATHPATHPTAHPATHPATHAASPIHVCFTFSHVSHSPMFYIYVRHTYVRFAHIRARARK